jgi:TRAP-type C4-dicarboxylate transport system permease small subunit
VTDAPVAAVDRRTIAAAMHYFRAVYGQVLEWLIVALMAILFAEVTLGVVFRIIGQSLAWYDEVASHMLAWLTFYGAALASVKRAHIGCPEVVNALPWHIRRYVNIVAQLIVIAFFVILGGVGIWIMPILATDSLVSVPWLPLSVVQSVIPISSILIVIAELSYLVELITATRPPQPVEVGAALADGLH